LFLAAALLIRLQGDQWIADHLYVWQGHRWALQSAFITQTLLHQGGRVASLVAWMLVVAALAWSHASARHRSWRAPLAYLVATTLVASVAVAWLKHASPAHCPWDLVRYGGQLVEGDVMHAVASGTGHGRCFPAGHASAGYAWVALYFVALRSQPGLRWWGLGVGLLAGIAFGFAQQLRGAHFLSHDLATLAVCWWAAVVLHLAWPPRPDARVPIHGPAGQAS